MSDLSIIQTHDGHYGQDYCGYSDGKIDYRSHFFSNDDAIKDAVEKNKPVVLSALTIQQLSLNNNVPFFFLYRQKVPVLCQWFFATAR